MKEGEQKKEHNKGDKSASTIEWEGSTINRTNWKNHELYENMLQSIQKMVLVPEESNSKTYKTVDGEPKEASNRH